MVVVLTLMAQMEMTESRPGVSKSIRLSDKHAVLAVCQLGLYRPYSSNNKERINVGSLLKKNVI